MKGCLQSFFKSHRNSLPLNDDMDYKYALYLCRSVSNIANDPEGRVFLLEVAECQKLIKEIIEMIPAVKCPTGETIKL